MGGVVAGPGGFCTSCQRGVEVGGRAVLPPSGGDQPDAHVSIRTIGPDRTTPTLDLHLEQHLIVDRGDALMRGRWIGELLVGFCEQRMIDLVEWQVRRGSGDLEVLA
ncbi:hypothetical protein AB0M46_41555 [Dactylosporangium sp. NPDC051485]|uniref:hypothetical protein n=1 Tax=Dactylosporangium sp. NPDC051485 TaxID=3154846 RepID=UPI0034287502